MSFTEGWVVGTNRWSKEYKRERTASWDDVAEEIRATVTMDDVLDVYAPSTPRRNHRCPCPMHCGTDYNFSYTDKGYKCFVCGESGDVIAFVKESLRLPTRADAMRRINEDLRLNIPVGGVISDTKVSEMALRRQAARNREEQRQEWLDRYHGLLDRWIDRDKVARTADPNSDEYAAAIREREILDHMLNSLPTEPR